MSFKASETLLGIETRHKLKGQDAHQGFKASETLLGIETDNNCDNDMTEKGFKASETLLGIETWVAAETVAVVVELQSLWNPFRDWNWNRGQV